jgi:hypothetical protein
MVKYRTFVLLRIPIPHGIRSCSIINFWLFYNLFVLLNFPSEPPETRRLCESRRDLHVFTSFYVSFWDPEEGT